MPPDVENTLVDAFWVWTEYNDDTFPSEINHETYLELHQKVQKADEETKECRQTQPDLESTTPDEVDGSTQERATVKDASKRTAITLSSVRKAMMYISQLQRNECWLYTGDGVKLGDADAPVCWWKPEGAETWRVIYGDLTVKDVAPGDVPERTDAIEP